MNNQNKAFIVFVIIVVYLSALTACYLLLTLSDTILNYIGLFLGAISIYTAIWITIKICKIPKEESKHVSEGEEDSNYNPNADKEA